MAQLLKGLPVAEVIREQVVANVDAAKACGAACALCVVRAGDDEASITYENSLEKLAAKLGVGFVRKVAGKDATTAELVSLVEAANADVAITGIIVMSPMPKGVDAGLVRAAIAPGKDVDGVTAVSAAETFIGQYTQGFPPATAEAVMRILDFYDVPLEGKRVCVVGRSLVVGKPVAMMLLEQNATVTICHSRTEGLADIVRESDVVICAVGRANFLDATCFDGSREQVVIDVGINVDEEGNLCGDVDFDAVEPLVGAITPVPGGVGTVATSLLLLHTANSGQ